MLAALARDLAGEYPPKHIVDVLQRRVKVPHVRRARGGVIVVVRRASVVVVVVVRRSTLVVLVFFLSPPS